MKHVSIIFIIILIIHLMTAQTGWAEESQITIRLSTFTDPGVPISASIEHFKQRVEADSGGKIHIEIYYSSTFAKETETIAAVSSGQIEMGVVLLTRYSKKIPITGVFQQPFLFNTLELEQDAIRSGSEIRRMVEDAILEHAGTRSLWWISPGRTVFLSNGFSPKSPDDIKNKMVRSLGESTEELIAICGGIPKDIPSSDQYNAYKNHEVDIGSTGVVTLFSRRFWEVMGTITRIHNSNYQVIAGMNEKFWESLSEKSRAIILKAAKSADDVNIKVSSSFDATSFEDISNKYGVKVVNITSDELLQWRICSSDVLQKFMDKTGDAGLKIMEAYGRMRARLCAQKKDCSAFGAEAQRAPSQK